jgi:putative PIN family toxin of toxin-antitoxin system
MKIVIDTNIFVSSFLWKGNPRKIIERVTGRLDKLYITDEILAEIRKVMLRDKFKLNEHTVDDYINTIKYFSIKVFPQNKIENISRDKDDDKFLKCGIESNADFIITGDIHLLELTKYEKIKIIKPKEYLEMVEKPNFA